MFGDYIWAGSLRKELQVSNDYEQVKAMSNKDFDGKYDFLFFILLTSFRRDCCCLTITFGQYFQGIIERYMAELGSNAVFFHLYVFFCSSSYVSVFIFPLSSRFRVMVPS